MAHLKVWVGQVDGVRRSMIACTNAKDARKALNRTPKLFRRDFKITHIKNDCDIATAKPGCIFTMDISFKHGITPIWIEKTS